MKHYTITVRGKTKERTFNFIGDPKYLKEWRDDGLEIDEVINSVPDWWPLHVAIYCFFQDLFNFKNPLKK